MLIRFFVLSPRRLEVTEDPDGGEARAQRALNAIVGLNGFLSAWDAEETSYFDVFREEPGDR